MKSCRLIYRSIAESSVLNSDSLSKLENQSASNNRRWNICGILAVSDGRFLQALEGIPKYVNQLFSKIIQDKRHHDVELISYEGIVSREYIDWNMKLLKLDEIDENVRALLMEKYPVVNNKFQFTDDSFLMNSLLLDIKHIHSK